MWARFLHRLTSLARHRRRQTDLRKEMGFHLAERTDELVRSGLDPVSARREARREFGVNDRFEEECRDAWGLRGWQNLRMDVKLAFRRLRRSKTFAAVVALTFALCVSLNTFTLGVLDSLLLNPGLFPDEDALVFLWEGDSTFASGHDRGLFPLELEDGLRRQTATLADAAYYTYAVSHVEWSAEAREVDLVENFVVGPEYFATLGVQPLRGRAFLESDVAGSGAPVAIITHQAWRNRFRGVADVVGRTIRIDGVVHEVVGVMPAKFVAPPDSWTTGFGAFEVLLPLTQDYRERYRSQFGHWVGLSVVGRLAPGASGEQAMTEIDALKRRLHPDRYEVADTPIAVTRYRYLGGELTREWADKLFLLQGAALVVLLLGCINIAGLIAGRNLARLRELAVRSALGASRARLVSQLLCESVMLSALGGVAGVGLAMVEFTAARSLGLFEQLLIDPQLSGRPGVLVASVGVAVLSGVGAGLVALWPVVARNNLDRYLKQDSRTGTSGRSAVAWRNGLVTTQVALAVMLLAASGLLTQSFSRALEVDLGFDPDHLLTARIKLPEDRYDAPAKRDFMLRLERELQTLPGIEAATLANQPPMAVTGGPGFAIEGNEPPEGASWPRCNLFTAGIGFAETLGIPVLRGRGFDARDEVPGNPPTVLVDQRFMDQYLPGEDPIGRRVHLNGRWWSIVGVVANVHYQDVTNALRPPTIYQTYHQRPPWWFVVMLRTRDDPMQSEAALRQAVAKVDPDIGVFNFETMDTLVTRSFADRVTLLTLCVVFTLVALLLTALGVYGLMAQGVAGRTREIGVRMAIGADAGIVIRQVLRDGMKHFGWGAGAGLVGSFAFARLLAAQLYATSPYDVRVYLAVLLVLACAIAAACIVPARRAAKVDPLIALRAE